MSPLCRPILCLAAVAAAMAADAQSSATAPAKPSPIADATNRIGSMNATSAATVLPVAQSPVDFFRKLLAASPKEREKLLASRPGMARARVVAKLREYEAMNPDERELTLRATELRWYLLPLMRAPKADRQAQLARIPPAMRDLVDSRLTQWDILPPPLQEEFLAHDTSRYFAQAPESPPNPAQQERIARQVSQFFALTDAEKEQLLGKLPESERTQMEQTLKTFEQLPLAQRNLCVRNYAKFAGMSEAERADFLKNAESWSKMSSDERQTWRDLVANVPSWPPLPPMPPPLPPILPKPAPSGVAVTN